MITLPVEPLTREAFAPFGEVLDADSHPHRFAINGGQCERIHRMATVESGSGRGIISVFRPAPVTLPLTLTLVERHPLGSQAFFPMAGQTWLVVVAPPGPVPTLEALRAFRVEGSVGINYFAGTWHHPLISLTAGDFLIVDREGPGNNCEEQPLTGVQLA